MGIRDLTVSNSNVLVSTNMLATYELESSYREGGAGLGVLMTIRAIIVRPLASHSYKAGTEHAGFSSDQARTQSPSAKRRGVSDASHEG